jgi:hypothetical protein
MAATMSIYFDWGGSDNSPGNSTDVDALTPNLRFKEADDATIDTSDPIVIPATGDTYSYWKQVYLYCDNADSNTIDNLRFYSDGTNNFGTGVDLEVGLQFPVHNSGSDAGYDVADTTNAMTDHTDITTKASVFNYDSGTPLSGPTISEGTGELDAAGESSNYLVLQMKVSSTASPGELPVDEQLTIKYDEA